MLTHPARGAGESATFNPVGIGVGRDGSVYVADYGNSRIRKVAVDGE